MGLCSRCFTIKFSWQHFVELEQIYLLCLLIVPPLHLNYISHTISFLFILNKSLTLHPANNGRCVTGKLFLIFPTVDTGCDADSPQTDRQTDSTQTDRQSKIELHIYKSVGQVGLCSRCFTIKFSWQHFVELKQIYLLCLLIVPPLHLNYIFTHYFIAIYFEQISNSPSSKQNLLAKKL